MVTHRYEKSWFYSHDVIDRWYVRPPVHVCQCDQYHASLQHTSLILDIHVLINWSLSKQGIRWPVSRDHIAGSSLELTEVSCLFKLTPEKVLVSDWIAGSTQVNSPKDKRGFIFRALPVARRGYKAIRPSTVFLTQSMLFVLRLKTVWKMFFSAFFAGFNPVWHIMISMVHTSGDAVI